jgi:hypothetical protein
MSNQKLEKRELEDNILISSGEFAFCRIGIMILVWLAFIFRIEWIIWFVFFVLLFSAVFTVKYAPMIVLWRYSFGLIFKSKNEVLNVKAMRFAHILGTVLAGICLLLLHFGNPNFAWGFVAFFAIMKTISALGFCPASKAYVCMSNGTCCAFSRKIKEIRTGKK